MRYVHQETTVNHFATDLDRTYMMSIEEESGRKYYAVQIIGIMRVVSQIH